MHLRKKQEIAKQMEEINALLKWAEQEDIKWAEEFLIEKQNVSAISDELLLTEQDYSFLRLLHIKA